MFLLIPGGQSAALCCMLGALVNFLVLNYANVPGFFGLTSTQWGIISLVMAF